MIFETQERDRSLKAVLRSSVSRLTLSGSLGLLGLAALPVESWAACTGAPPSFICDGANTVTQNVAADNATVTTLPGFSVNVAPSGDSALIINGDGALSYIDDNNSVLTGYYGLYMAATGDGGGNPGSIAVATGGRITGEVTGIVVTNEGSGSIGITAGGLVEGGVIGIGATNQATAGNLTVDAATVSGGVGGSSGIFVINSGSGFTRVTATGLVQGGSAAIVALNTTTATSLTIDAAATAVLGGENDFDAAIYAFNGGVGFTSITATGTTDGALSLAGILAYNETTASSLTIEATSVLGGLYGIQAVNSGDSFTNITATGDVVGAFTGINVINGQIDDGDLLEPFPNVTGPGGTDLTVDAATVSGGYVGIFVTNNGSRFTSVTATGLVQGGIAGIVALNETTATDLTITAAGTAVLGNSGGGLGAAVYAVNEGTGATRITATGTADGALSIAGILAFNEATASSLTIEATSVSGGFYGIQAVNSGTGATRVTATGEAIGGFAGINVINGEIDDGDLFEPFPDVTGPGGTDLTVDAAAVGGGYVGIFTQNYGSGSTAITATGLVQGGIAGIVALNETTATDLTITAAGTAVLGNSGEGLGAAIYAVNEGTGATRITATGTTDGALSIAGILAFNEATASSLSVEATSVLGGYFGIQAVNSGTGATRVTATGEAFGGFVGINVINGEIEDGDLFEPFPDVTGPGGTDLTVDAAAVSGGYVGLFTQNYGSGSTAITTTGLVQGGIAGIVALNETTATDLTITAAGTAVLGNSGGGLGAAIYAVNEGTGATRITATGTTDGALSIAGILAFNEATASSLSVEATSVTGGLYGVLAANAGTGGTSVTATGNVDGGIFAGIAAINGQVNLGDAISGQPYPTGPAGTDLTVSANSVVGKEYGIYAVNLGSGATSVTAAGDVSGENYYGILAINGFGATDLTVNAANTVGSYAAIAVQNDGSGFTRLTSGGNAVAPFGSGIDAFGGNTTTTMTIAANGAVGGQYGINARHFGSGALSISSSGLVQGGVAAISATSNDQPIEIVNDGAVRNLLSSSLAVEATGGPVRFTNNGGLFGTVLFGADGNSLTNAGIWNSAGGASDFGGGANQLVNGPAAIIFAATNGSAAETTAFNNATSFTNRGTFSVMDGGAGDRATLSGSASFEVGSVYAIDVGTGAQSDLLTVDGIATLMAGSTLTVNIANGLSYGARYTVLTANGGLDGQFGSFAGASTAFLSIDDVYDANNVYLDVTQYRSFTEAALTPNQLETSGGLQSLPTDTVLFAAVAGLPTDAQAQGAFDSLSGEIGASAKGVLLNDSQFLRSAVFDRLTSAGSSTSAGGIAVAPLGYAAPAKSNVPYPVKAQPVVAAEPESAFWAQAYGSWGDTNGNGNAAGLDRNAGGFFIGADTLVGDAWRLGVLGGYSQTSFDVDARASSGDSDNFHLGAYAGTNWGAVNFRAGASYTWNDISTSRSVFIPTAQLLQADYDAGTAQVFGELGYGLTFGAVDFEPFVGLAYVNLSTDGYTETGGIAALNSASDSTDATYSTLGLRASTSFALGSFDATAKGLLGWRHAFGDITPTSAYQFASGSSPFTVGGVPIAEDAALVEVGLDVQLMPLATFGVAYGGQFGDGATDQSLTAKLNWKF